MNIEDIALAIFLFFASWSRIAQVAVIALLVGLMAIKIVYKKDDGNEDKTITKKQILVLSLLNYVPSMFIIGAYVLSYFPILNVLSLLLYLVIVTFVVLQNVKTITQNSVLVFVNLHLLIINSVGICTYFLSLSRYSLEVLCIMLFVHAVIIIGSTIFRIRINIEKNKKVYAENIKIEKEKISNNEGTLEEKMIYAYIGKNVSKILTSKINIPAALLGPIWYLYRKSYKLAFNSFLPCFISLFLLGVILLMPLEGPGVAGLFEVFVLFNWLILTVIALIIVAITNLFNANKFYRTNVEKIIKRIIEENKDMEEDALIELAREKGQISVFEAINDKISNVNIKK